MYYRKVNRVDTIKREKNESTGRQMGNAGSVKEHIRMEAKRKWKKRRRDATTLFVFHQTERRHDVPHTSITERDPLASLAPLWGDSHPVAHPISFSPILPLSLCLSPSAFLIPFSALPFVISFCSLRAPRRRLRTRKRVSLTCETRQ